MIDWGISGAITALIAFICNCITDSKVKKLNNRIADLEERLKVFESSAEIAKGE